MVALFEGQNSDPGYYYHRIRLVGFPKQNLFPELAVYMMEVISLGVVEVLMVKVMVTGG